MADINTLLPELTGDEREYVQGLVADMPDDAARAFAAAYRQQRRDPTNVLLLALLGFVALAGLHRFYLADILWGVLFLLTAGFCFVGTIIDLINHKTLTLRYNQAKAVELAGAVRRGM